MTAPHASSARAQQMKTYILLLRGINVGGNNSLPMKALTALLETLDIQTVRTYIQSGNVVCQSGETDAAQLAGKVSTAIKKSHGFEPHVLVLAKEDLKKVIESNPFPEAEADPKTLHVNFLAAVPENPDLNALERIKREGERFELQGKVFYLHAPEGIGRSKLAANTEKLLGVAMTGRNWRTVRKIMEMVDATG